MSTFNGTGTKLHGWSATLGPDRTAYATRWFVLFYLPILPLNRYLLRVPCDHADEGFFGRMPIEHYEILDETPLAWGEALGTWWTFLRAVLLLSAPIFVLFLSISSQNARVIQGLPRSGGLTALNIVCLGLFVLGIVLLVRRSADRPRA